MTRIPDDADRCTAIVFEGRGTFHHRCLNRAKPGTDKCGTHTRREPDKTKTDPTADPEVSTRVVTHVTLRWAPGTGPVSVRSYTTQRVQWDRISASTTDGSTLRVDGAFGVQLKKDGTRAERTVDGRFMRLEDFPDNVQTLIRNHLEA